MDKFFIRIGNKFCAEIEPDYKIVKSDFFLMGKALFYRYKGENTHHTTDTENLLVNPKVTHGVGSKYFKLVF